MKEFEIEAWEVRKFMDDKKLDFDDAAAYVALEQAGYFEGSGDWGKYAAAEVGEDAEQLLACELQKGSREYLGDEIAEKYFDQYGEGRKGSATGPLLWRESVEKMSPETPIYLFPDWDEWTTSFSYVRICQYYRLNVTIRVS